MKGKYEVLTHHQSLQAIGQRMIDEAKHEPACSYRWCIRDIASGHTHKYHSLVRCPASSTRKLFVLLAVLQLIEQGEWKLEDLITVDNRRAGRQTCGGLWLLDRPRIFSVAELLKLMMALSDNVATFFLVEKLTFKRLNELSAILHLAGTHHLSSVPNPSLTADHPLSVVNTTTASDLVTALAVLVEGILNHSPAKKSFISRELCEFGLYCMRGQQDSTAIRGWLNEPNQIGDKQGVGFRNYNNVGFLAEGSRIKIIFSIIVDDLHLIKEPVPAFDYARNFIAQFSRMLEDYCRHEHISEEI